MEADLTEYGRIASHYQCEKLEDLCASKTGIQTGPFGSQLHKEDYVDEGTPIITVEHLLENRISHVDAPLVSDEDRQRLKKYSLEEGDIVFSRVGSVDRRSLVREAENGWLFSGRCLRVRVNKEKIDPTYLSYFFGHEGFKNYIRSIAVGATMPSINTKILSEVPVYYPRLTEQRYIAHILGTLDDKIELNRQMNATLEAMAQALFKSWFVDFDPVIDNALAAGNPIPEPLHARAEARKALGDKRKPLSETIQQQFPSRFVFSEEMGWVPGTWDPVKLGEYVTVKRGGSPRPIHDYLVDEGLPWVKISDATASSSRYLMGTKQFIKPEGLNKTVLLKKGELILSNSATPGLPKFLNLDACIHDGWLYFPEKTLYGDLYLYQLFLVVRDELLMQGNGSVFTNLKTDILKNHLVVKPDEVLLIYAEDRFSELHKRSLLIQMEINSLVKIRDLLLPSLLSGKLRTPEAAK